MRKRSASFLSLFMAGAIAASPIVASSATAAETDTSSSSSTAAHPGAPSAVRNASVNLNGAEYISVFWSAPASTGNARILSYDINVTDSAGNTYQDSVNANTRSSSIYVGDLPGRTLTVVVSATNKFGSTPLEVGTVEQVLEAPGMPQGFSVEPNGNLTWFAPESTMPVTSYVIHATADGEALDDVYLSAEDFSYQYPTTPGVDYSFFISASNDAGEGEAAVIDSFIMDSTVSDAPSDVYGVTTDNGITVRWNAPAFTGGQDVTYTVSLNDSLGNTTVLSGLTETQVEFAINAIPGVYYTAAVSAVNSAGESGTVFSESFSGGAEQAASPSYVDAYTSGYANHSVFVRWSPPETDGGSSVTEYVVQLTDFNDPEAAPIVQHVSADNFSTNFTGLAASKFYEVKVTAMNSVGESTASYAYTTTYGDAPYVPIEEEFDSIDPSVVSIDGDNLVFTLAGYNAGDSFYTSELPDGDLKEGTVVLSEDGQTLLVSAAGYEVGSHRVGVIDNNGNAVGSVNFIVNEDLTITL